MNILLQLLVGLGAGFLALFGLTACARRKSGAGHSLSWKHYRYAFVVLALFVPATLIFQPLSPHSRAYAATTGLSRTHVATTALYDYVMCGTEAQMPLNTYPGSDQYDPTSNQWTYVPTTASHGSINGPLGYTGSRGDLNKKDGQTCGGDYYYGWDQYYHKAVWTTPEITDASHLSQCFAEVHIPSWYAGSHHAHYTLSLTSAANSGVSVNQTVQADPVNQDQGSNNTGLAGWIRLTMDNDVHDLNVPITNQSIHYNLTLTLLNGGDWGWYLGADAVEFSCI